MVRHPPIDPTDAKKRLTVVLVSDGRPGHEKQSRGVIKALQRYCPVDVTPLFVSRASLLQESSRFLSYFWGSTRAGSTAGTFDLAIGTGSRTHIEVLSRARAGSARSVVCMTPPWPLRSRFDLCFCPLHDRVRPAENVMLTIGPPNTAEADQRHNENAGLICVGGSDPSSHLWDERRVVQNIKMIATKSSIREWIISSSPRTPESTEQLLVTLASEMPTMTFIPFRVTASGWIEEQYRQHKTVWITADSISMVYEALSAGCRVGIIPVDWKRLDSKFHYSERYLISKGLVVSLSDWLNGTGRWHDLKPLDEADRCAREILKRWWPSNLQ